MTGIEHGGGWIIGDTEYWIFLAVWGVLVLVYGLYRSQGDAKPDPIRASGPLVE